MAYAPNPGHLPFDCTIFNEEGQEVGFRSVHVRLFNGWDSKKAGASPWPAAGARPPTRWEIDRRPHPFQIKEYECV